MSVWLRDWSALDPRLELPALIRKLNERLGPRDTLAPYGLGFPIRTVTANVTVDGQDCAMLVDATAGNRTVTLPRADQSLGRFFRVKKIDASANTVTVQASAGTIDGAATNVIGVQYVARDFMASNGNWWVF